MYVSHNKRVACRVEILKGLRVVRFGTLVTFGFLGIYGEELSRNVREEVRKVSPRQHCHVFIPWAVGVSIIGCQLPATSYQ